MHQQDNRRLQAAETVWTDRHAHNNRTRHMLPRPFPGSSCRVGPQITGTEMGRPTCGESTRTTPPSAAVPLSYSKLQNMSVMKGITPVFLPAPVFRYNFGDLNWFPIKHEIHNMYKFLFYNLIHISVAEKKDSNEAMLLSIFENSGSCLSSECGKTILISRFKVILILILTEIWPEKEFWLGYTNICDENTNICSFLVTKQQAEHVWTFKTTTDVYGQTLNTTKCAVNSVQGNYLLNKMLQSVFCLSLVTSGVLADVCCSSAHAWWRGCSKSHPRKQN